MEKKTTKTSTSKKVKTKNTAAKKVASVKWSDNKEPAKTTKKTFSKHSLPKPPAQNSSVTTTKKNSVETKSKNAKGKPATKQSTAIVKTSTVGGTSQKIGTAKKMQPLTEKQIFSLGVIGALIIALIIILPVVLTTWVGGSFVQAYSTTARHGYTVEDLGQVERKLPTVTKDGGLATGYPVYGRTMNLNDAQKDAIISEAVSLCTRYTTNTGGSFDKMDKDGFLYLSDGTKVLDSEGQHRRLYKHTAADSMYYGGLSDDEPAVSKRFTFVHRNHGGGYNVTGLYAPAGEIIKVEIKKETLLNAYTWQQGRRYNGVMIHIGQALYNGQANNIWSQRAINRMPLILSTFLLNPSNCTYNEETETYTCYIGSYLGGPIYVRDANIQVSLTISGAVNYRHFILGKTTEQEFKELCKSTAPYFDLEVWDAGVLHSGPLYRAQNFSYKNLYDAAILWEKISLVSTNVGANGKLQSIVNIYDPFVAAGAAVAFPGRSSTNCPDGWMTSALNVESFITGGAWGVMHEFNHNFQGWGLPVGGEVTNNALNLVSYSQFTKISSSRTLTSSGMGGLSGWNAYTNAPWALQQVLNKNYGSTSQLCIYSTLLHNIGAKNFMNSANRGGVDNYFKDVCAASGYDMSYFFKELIAQVPSEAAVETVKGLPKFVPVSCVYQTGRSLAPNEEGKKEYFKTMQPFVINYGEDMLVDLSPYATQTADGNTVYKSGSVVIPKGFSYSIKNISNPQYGRIVKQSDYVYTYIPDRKHLDSGKIYVTLSITKDDNAFTVEDVDLVLEFAQTHERNKTMLERTVYTYDTLPFTTARQAYEENYKGFESKTEENNVNPTQNSNTDIWVPNPQNNAVMEIKGKLYVPSSGDYRLALRGRHSCALYISYDGNKYQLAAELNHNTQTNTFWENDDTTYYDFENLSVGQWIYFKEVLLVDYPGAFIGLGWGKFEAPSGVMDDDGIFRDENGNEITDFTPKVRLAYASAYRSTYEFPNNTFETDYLFTKNFSGTYNGNVNYTNKGKLVSISGYTPWGGYSNTLDELFDDNDNNWIHSAKSDSGEVGKFDITPNSPFDMTIDLEKNITANSLTIYGKNNNNYLPENFVIYGGTKLNKLKQLATQENATKVGKNLVVSFNATTLRYYRLVCTGTTEQSKAPGYKYISFRCIKFDYNLKLENAQMLAPDDKSISYRGKWSVANGISNFGRLYFAKKNATATFTFTGSQFAIYSNTNYKNKIKVFVDGKDCTNVVVKEDKNTLDATFCSPLLYDGKHTVKIVSTGGCNISCILYK